MAEQEGALDADGVEFVDVGPVDAARDQREAEIAGDGDDRPDDDLRPGAGEDAARHDDEHHKRDRRRRIDHRAGVKLQEFALENRVALALRQAFARAPDRLGDIGVAMRLPAVHDILVGKLRA